MATAALIPASCIGICIILQKKGSSAQMLLRSTGPIRMQRFPLVLRLLFALLVVLGFPLRLQPSLAMSSPSEQTVLQASSNYDSESLSIEPWKVELSNDWDVSTSSSLHWHVPTGVLLLYVAHHRSSSRMFCL